MSKPLTYSNAGVNREVRKTSKEALALLKATYQFSEYGSVINLPYGKIFPFINDSYLDLVIEGIGTKVLVAQLAEKYDTIGIDGVAMAVNDVIRSGAKPLAIADNIHAHCSNPLLVKEWMKGIVVGAAEAECIVPSGEIGDVAELIKGVTRGKGFDMVMACLGAVSKDKIIRGTKLKPGDSIIGFKSSGLHSNGISLARKVLFKQWGGKYEFNQIPDRIDRELAFEVLEPTVIYVKSFLKIVNCLEIKAAIHITGDAYLKFNQLTRFSPKIGFEFTHFAPHQIFHLIQDAAQTLGSKITDEEMFKTFNMGWGFAIIIDKKDVDVVIDLAGTAGVEAEQIGRVTDFDGICIKYRNQNIVLK